LANLFPFLGDKKGSLSNSLPGMAGLKEFGAWNLVNSAPSKR